MANSEPRFSYDEVPYPDMPYVQTHPEWLAMVGKLLGMNPAPVEQCRVLEIGTAGGANLLGMAAVLPDSTFVGIDKSTVQIAQAQAAVEATGMTNIRFQAMDMLDVTPAFGEFDYIIAHGIYSWVPPVVKDKLLAICKQNLAPQGIVYISYNTYPGWHTLDIMRNMMTYRTRDISDPVEKSAQARAWISFMVDALWEQPDSAYAAMFRTYLDSRATQSTEFDHALLLHDELEVYNTPLYFHQFVDHAQQHGLQYLAESEFPKVMPNGLSDEVLDYLSQTARTTIEMEQYLDFLRNQTFRRTLLCHDDIAVNRRLSIEPLREFYISSSAHTVTPDAEKEAKGVETFEGIDGSRFSTDHPLTIAAFHYLMDTKPLRVHFPTLVREAAARVPTPITQQDAVGMAANLLRAFTYSLYLIELHTFAPRMTTTVSERPLVTAFARFQTRHYSTVASLIHARVQLDNFNRLVLAQLDGKTDRAAILKLLVQSAEKGELSLPTGAHIPAAPDEMRQKLATELDYTLGDFAELGLLMA